MKELKNYLIEKESGFYRWIIDGKSWIIKKSPRYNLKTCFDKWELTVFNHNEKKDWWDCEILHHEKRCDFNACKRTILYRRDEVLNNPCQAIYNPFFNEFNYK